jgi:allantoin racemase
MTNRSKPRESRVLFLTPFNFQSPEIDCAFDALAQRQFERAGISNVTADHVERFDFTDDNYEQVQEDAINNGIARAEREGFDVIVNACFYDPALANARQAANVPVVGALQLCAGLTTQFGPKFAAITDIAEAETVIAELIAGYGYAENCTGVTALNIEGDDIVADTKATAEAVNRMVKELAESGEVQSVLIACTIVSAAYEEHRDEFVDPGIPVINSNLSMVRNAQVLGQFAQRDSLQLKRRVNL